MTEYWKNQIQLCKEIATEAHKGQKRRCGEDYINHPKRVAEHFEAKFMCVECCVGWLHDVIEDTEISEHYLLDKGVNQYIVSYVKALTKTANTKYDDYIDNIIHHKNKEILVAVKIVDMIDNITKFTTKRQKQKYTDALLKMLV